MGHQRLGKLPWLQHSTLLCRRVRTVTLQREDKESFMMETLPDFALCICLQLVLICIPLL